MKKILSLLIILTVLITAGCTNAKPKSKDKSEAPKQSTVSAVARTEAEQVETSRFLKPQKTDGMVTIISKGKINREKDFGRSLNEGLEKSLLLCVSGDVIMVVLDYEEGGGQAVMAEYDNFMKLKNKEITIDEFMNNIVIKDMTYEEVEKVRNVF